MPIRTNLVGKRFGKLLVVSLYSRNTTRRKKTEIFDNGKLPSKCRTCWLCKCDCGKEVIANQNVLHQGNKKSCGCLPKGKPPQDYTACHAVYRGYRNNARVNTACETCNYAKSNLGRNEFTAWIRRAYKHVFGGNDEKAGSLTTSYCPC